MRRWLRALCAGLLAAAMLSGCAAAGQPKKEAALTFTDALGYSVELASWERVVSLYGSFAETWTLAGGQLCGATSDALEERGMELGPDVTIAGTVKEPNFEEILALEPDFVILSADIAPQVDLHAALTEASVPHAYYRVDGFGDYLSMLEQFCAMTGRDDLYEQNGLAVQRQVESVLADAEEREGPSVLLLRAFSTGVKAKGEDNLAGVMLRELGADNLVSRYESLLEDVSLEEVIAADPDFLFIVTMGASEEKALDYLREHFESSPAWADLSAVKNGRVVLLPKDLFHYKPNARWGESYAYLQNILYPEPAAQVG